MRRADVRGKVEKFLEQLGVPRHCVSVRDVKPSTEVKVLIAGQPHIVRMRSGITMPELDNELDRLARAYRSRVVEGQTDLEDFTAGTPNAV